MNIEYSSEKLEKNEFIDILKRSTLAHRRPIDDVKMMKNMVENCSIMIVAKEGEKIIGVARSISDFSYCCYLSDLAVDQEYQRQGIGKMLIKKTQEQLQDNCKIILLSAPDATEYYPKLGFEKHPSAWVLQK
jgi:predicted N-acetyltransferase YhbS